jgi:hypothetical protein
MKLFRCQSCGNTVLFENTRCESCGHELGFLPHMFEVSAVERQGPNWLALASTDRPYRFCANWEANGCNWLVAADDGAAFCRACRHNRTIPNLSDAISLLRWRKVEHAKKRLIYTLLHLRLPLPTSESGDREPLMFDFLSDEAPGGARVMTGHDNGLITLSIAEADDALREKNRLALGEPYRTLLGHFRHEVGHFYWDRLVRDAGETDACREVFGDDRADYATALQRYYANGAPSNWNENFVSQYASSHPWEDFAESFAHYLHIIDTLDTARAVGVRMNNSSHGEKIVDFDPHGPIQIERLIEVWTAVSFAVNCLNRSMGLPDLYPFVLSPKSVSKLGLINSLAHRRKASDYDAPADAFTSTRTSSFCRPAPRITPSMGETSA